jgi:undecaprenyl pyrophosphate phosphatase UppP
MQRSSTIPRPLVRTNQWVIVLSVLVTWVTGAYWILLIPFIAGIMGIVVGLNPIMRLATVFLRKPLSEYVPEDRDQQQFNQIIAVACLALGLIGYLMHWLIVAYLFTAMVALAAFIAILGFCIGCFIRYQWTQYRYRRAQRHS